MARDHDKAERKAEASAAPARVEEALRLLTEELTERLDRHPWGHLLQAGDDTLPLDLELPTSLRRGIHHGALDELAAGAADALDEALQQLLTHKATLKPGTVFCLRCGAADCEHARPREARQVFAGFGPSGLPRFADLGQLLLERGDPDVDLLYRGRTELVARVMPGAMLTSELLDAYRNPQSGYRIHGQVVAGWYRVPDPSGRKFPMAVTLQVVSTRPEGTRGRRYALNVLGRGPGDEPLEHLHDRLGEIPWSESVRWAQTILDTLGTQGKKGRKRKRGQTERRIEGILQSIARRLEKDRRSRNRKTRHARERHAQGDRPTNMALPDLAQAPPDDILVDVRAETLVVLGEKGRAHVFSPEGKHVTSVRYNPDSIARRRERKLWRAADTDEIRELRQAVAAQGEQGRT